VLREDNKIGVTVFGLSITSGDSNITFTDKVDYTVQSIVGYRIAFVKWTILLGCHC
jgi:hypothetical protein